MTNFLVSLAATVLAALLLIGIEHGGERDLRDMSGGNLRSTLTKRVFEYWFDGTPHET